MLVWLRHLNAHQKIALFYLTINLPIFGILTADAFDPKIRYTFELFALSITAVIVIAPYCLRFAPVNKLFGWTDVLTAEEKNAVFCFELFKLGKKRYAPSYTKRIKPFVYRIGGCCIASSLVGVSSMMNGGYLSILCGAIAFYLFTILLILTTSVFTFKSDRQN